MCGVAACRSASPVRLRSAGGRSADATCLTGGNCAIFDKTYKKLGRLFRGHQQVVIAAVSTPPTLPRLAIRVYAYRRSTAYVSGACQTARRGSFSQGTFLLRFHTEIVLRPLRHAGSSGGSFLLFICAAQILATRRNGGPMAETTTARSNEKSSCRCIAGGRAHSCRRTRAFMPADAARTACPHSTLAQVSR
jgi:hypothetical protein